MQSKANEGRSKVEKYAFVKSKMPRIPDHAQMYGGEERRMSDQFYFGVQFHQFVRVCNKIYPKFADEFARQFVNDLKRGRGVTVSDKIQFTDDDVAFSLMFPDWWEMNMKSMLPHRLSCDMMQRTRELREAARSFG